MENLEVESLAVKSFFCKHPSADVLSFALSPDQSVMYSVILLL